MAGRERFGDFLRVDSVGLGQPHGFGDDAVIRQHQRLVDELGRLPGADRRPYG